MGSLPAEPRLPDPALLSMPHGHHVASLLKRWLLRTYRGAGSNAHLQYYLDEFTLRFNRRGANHRGMLFYRLLKQTTQTVHTTTDQLFQGSAAAGAREHAFFFRLPRRLMHISSAVPVRALALLAGLFFGSTAQSVAQERLPSLAQGEPVRVTSDLLPGRTVALFQGFEADTLLVVRQSGGSVSLPLSRIEQLETARKDRLTGALIGAPVGALLLTTGLAVWAHSQGGWMCCGNDWRDNLGFSVIFGVPIGGVVGAITGGVIGTKRWDPVPTVTDRP